MKEPTTIANKERFTKALNHLFKNKKLSVVEFEGSGVFQETSDGKYCLSLISDNVCGEHFCVAALGGTREECLLELISIVYGMGVSCEESYLQYLEYIGSE